MDSAHRIHSPSIQRQGSHGATFLRKRRCCFNLPQGPAHMEVDTALLASRCWGSTGCRPQGGQRAVSSEARPGKEPLPSSRWPSAQLPSLRSQSLTSCGLLAGAAGSTRRPATNPSLPAPRLCPNCLSGSRVPRVSSWPLSSGRLRVGRPGGQAPGPPGHPCPGALETLACFTPSCPSRALGTDPGDGDKFFGFRWPRGLQRPHITGPVAPSQPPAPHKV